MKLLIYFKNHKFTYFLLSILSLTLFSCNSDKPDTSNISINIEFKDFTKDIMEIKGEITKENLIQLRSDYGSFYDDYITYIMGYGSPLSDTALRALNFFKEDNHEQHLYKVVQDKFGDFKKQKKEIISLIRSDSAANNPS